MRALSPLLTLLLLCGCETSRTEPYAPVENVHYNALGEEPFWMVAIGDDRIVLRLADESGRPQDAIWPRTLPRTVDGVRIWQSGEGTQVISIEARPSPCEGSRGQVYEDQVRVRLSGRELLGCGGRLIGREGDR